MNSDNDFDTLLTSREHDEMPHADAFVGTLMARVDQHHRYRRIVLVVIGSLVALGACAAMMRLPASVAFGSSENPFQTGILFALAALCGWAWVVTEETRLPNYRWRCVAGSEGPPVMDGRQGTRHG